MSRVSRRTFLRAGVTVAAVVSTTAVLSGEAFAATPVLQQRRLPLTRSAFAALVGSRVRMMAAGEVATVRVASVEDIKPKTAVGDENRFSVLFRAPRGTDVESGMHRFLTSGGESVELFVAPVDRGVKARYYQAVINRPA